MDDLATIIDDFQRGDDSAFGSLVTRYQNTAVAYAYSVLGDFHLAQDAAQEAFLTAYRDLPTLTSTVAFPSWFRKIVYKYCDRIKRRRRHPSIPIDEAPEIADRSTDPAEVFAMNEARLEQGMQIALAMQSLTDADRQVVSLFYMGENSVEQIGVFLQITPTAVKKRLQRARERLKERMLKMIEQSLTEMAPSHNTRFVEAAALLRRAHQALETDDRIVAAWLGDSFGIPGDNGWTMAWLQVVVKDEYIDDFIRDRRRNVALLGDPLLIVEATQNAPPGGAYLMATYDGEAGPYEINWYWQPATGAIIPEKTTIPSGAACDVIHVLFDKVGLPKPDGYVLACDYNRNIPAVLKAELDARDEATIQRDEATNCVNCFWGMLLISGRSIVTAPSEAEPQILDMIHGLLAKVRKYVGLEEASPSGGPFPDRASKVDHLRMIAKSMTDVMPAATKLGVEINPAIVDRSYRFLDMVERQ